jgi:hypothetical protein
LNRIIHGANPQVHRKFWKALCYERHTWTPGLCATHYRFSIELWPSSEYVRATLSFRGPVFPTLAPDRHGSIITTQKRHFGQ